MSDLGKKRVCSKEKVPYMAILWLSGGLLYYYMEIFIRGYSHISMIVCAGVCFLILGKIGEQRICKRKAIGHGETAIIGALLISTIELATGIVVNIVLELNVWDYSKQRYNLFGQICPTYTCLWGVISIPAVYLYMLIKTKIFQINNKSL